MKRKFLLFKKTSLAIISTLLLLISVNVVAQKSIYDVIPGSGPKKTTKQREPTLNKKHDNRKDEIGPYTTRRKHLPPGQAKKIYGGSAKDYAPGQIKKRYNRPGKYKHQKKHWNNYDDKNNKKENKNHDD